eukprot:Rmarinus@m.27196
MMIARTSSRLNFVDSSSDATVDLTEWHNIEKQQKNERVSVVDKWTQSRFSKVKVHDKSKLIHAPIIEGKGRAHLVQDASQTELKKYNGFFIGKHLLTRNSLAVLFALASRLHIDVESPVRLEVVAHYQTGYLEDRRQQREQYHSVLLAVSYAILEQAKHFAEGNMGNVAKLIKRNTSSGIKEVIEEDPSRAPATTEPIRAPRPSSVKGLSPRTQSRRPSLVGSRRASVVGSRRHSVAGSRRSSVVGTMLPIDHSLASPFNVDTPTPTATLSPQPQTQSQSVIDTAMSRLESRPLNVSSLNAFSTVVARTTGTLESAMKFYYVGLKASVASALEGQNGWKPALLFELSFQVASSFYCPEANTYAGLKRPSEKIARVLVDYLFHPLMEEFVLSRMQDANLVESQQLMEAACDRFTFFCGSSTDPRIASLCLTFFIGTTAISNKKLESDQRYVRWCTVIQRLYSAALATKCAPMLRALVTKFDSAALSLSVAVHSVLDHCVASLPSLLEDLVDLSLPLARQLLPYFACFMLGHRLPGLSGLSAATIMNVLVRGSEAYAETQKEAMVDVQHFSFHPPPEAVRGLLEIIVQWVDSDPRVLLAQDEQEFAAMMITDEPLLPNLVPQTHGKQRGARNFSMLASIVVLHPLRNMVPRRLPLSSVDNDELVCKLCDVLYNNLKHNERIGMECKVPLPVLKSLTHEITQATHLVRAKFGDAEVPEKSCVKLAAERLSTFVAVQVEPLEDAFRTLDTS